MKEEKIGILNVRHLIPSAHDAIKPYTLLLTNHRIIAVPVEGINWWTIVTVTVAFVTSFMGLLLRNVVLFVGGVVVGIMAVLLIVLISFVIRQRKIGKMQRLNPKRVLEMNEKNFEIGYAKIVKVVVRTLKTYPGGNYLFPSFQEHRFKIDFITHTEKYSFILNGGKLQQCLNLIQQFVPEIIEIDRV